jgi:hypothetical protein
MGYAHRSSLLIEGRERWRLGIGSEPTSIVFLSVMRRGVSSDQQTDLSAAELRKGTPIGVASLVGRWGR